MSDGWYALILVLCFGALIVSLLLPIWKPKATSRFIVRRATKLYHQLQIAFQPRHEYRKVDQTKARNLNRRRYAELRRELEDLGFRHIGDMEDVTLSRAHPNLPKIVSLFVHNGEAVIAACHHACLNAWTRFNLWLKVIPHDAVVLEFQTEFTDGVFIETVNSSKSLDSAENVRMERLPPETRPEALLGAHRAAVEEYAASHPDAYPIRITNYEDLIGSQHRQTASEHEHRDRIGYISEDEIVGCARAGEKPIAKAMYAATQTLHKQKTHTDHRQAVERGAID